MIFKLETKAEIWYTIGNQNTNFGGQNEGRIKEIRKALFY